MQKIRQAVIPAAGLGTRFLPATKILPKELLPIYDRPAMEYIADELVASGVEEVIFVLHPVKQSILDHFQPGSHVEKELKSKGKLGQFPSLNKYQDKLYFKAVYQHEPRGLGHAVACAKKEIRDDFFAVILPDDLVESAKPCLAQLIETWATHQKSTVAVQAIEPELSNLYGIINPKHKVFSPSVDVLGVVEKPLPKDAPSHWSIIGRYILSRSIFEDLEKIQSGALGELQLTDALELQAKKQTLMAHAFEGERLDIGKPNGFLEANIFYGLRSKEKKEIQTMLKKFVSKV